MTDVIDTITVKVDHLEQVVNGSVGVMQEVRAALKTALDTIFELQKELNGTIGADSAAKLAALAQRLQAMDDKLLAGAQAADITPDTPVVADPNAGDNTPVDTGDGNPVTPAPAGETPAA